MINARLLTLHHNIQCFTCQFRIMLLKKSSESLKTQSTLWLKRHSY